MAGTSGFFILEDTLTGILDDAPEEVMAEVQERCLKLAEDILAYAKQNAPWQDRTGDARAGLDVDVSESGGAIYIQLYHQVDYGLWLEVIQNGRFAIIMPTLEQFSGTMIEVVSEDTGGDS